MRYSIKAILMFCAFTLCGSVYASECNHFYLTPDIEPATALKETKKFIKKNGVNHICPNTNHETALMVTIQSIKNCGFEKTPRTENCYKGATMIIDQLLNAGANPNTIIDRKAKTSALYELVRYRSPKLNTAIENILKAGANPNIASGNGSTPLSIYSEARNLDGINLLLKFGADINAGDGSAADGTALHYAVRNSFYDAHEAIELLISKGANVNSINRKGAPVLVYANPKYYDILISNGADINHKDYSGRTPIFHMCDYYFASLPDFLKLKPDLDARDHKGNTALHHYLKSTFNHYKEVKALTEAGIDINAKNLGGETAISLALDKRNMKLIDMLLEAGAEPTRADRSMVTLMKMVK